MIVIVFEGEPIGKGRPRFTRMGRAYTPAKTRAYEEKLRHQGALAMDGRDPLTGPISVTVCAVFPIPPSWSKGRREAARLGDTLPTKVPDADNLLKVLDAFNGIIWNDDRQIVSATINKIYGERPRLRVEVEEIEAHGDAEALGMLLFDGVAA